MRDGVLIGMAVGAVLGAILVEGNKPVGELVHQSKQCVKEKADVVSKVIKNKKAQE